MMASEKNMIQDMEDRKKRVIDEIKSNKKGILISDFKHWYEEYKRQKEIEEAREKMMGIMDETPNKSPWWNKPTGSASDDTIKDISDLLKQGLPKKKPKELPDVPTDIEFVLPLWLGKECKSPVMSVLNDVYSSHGDKPVNGCVVVQRAMTLWYDVVVRPRNVSYVSLKNPSVTANPQYISVDSGVGVWDVEMKVKSIEFLPWNEDDAHGTPLRIVISIDSVDAAIVANEINRNGRFYISGHCDIENNDIVGLSITSLCYLELTELSSQEIFTTKLVEEEPPF